MRLFNEKLNENLMEEIKKLKLNHRGMDVSKQSITS